MTETTVGHTKQDETDVYIGRGPGGRDMTVTDIGDRGWLGNPYPAEKFGREECIRLFRRHFENLLSDAPHFRNKVRDLSGSTLGCWCRSVDDDAPECHGDVIAEHADRLAAEVDE